jgi:glycosyltransferase involved in cell wall biosynthesis
MSEKYILHLIDSSGMYGAEKMLLMLLEELKGSKYPGILGCIRETTCEIPDIAREAEDIGIPVVYFTMHRGYNPKGVRSILRFIKDHQIKIVHSHGYKSNIFLGLQFKTEFKRISTIHGWSKEYGGLKNKTYEMLDSLSLRRFDSVVAVSQSVATDLKKKGLNGKNITVIHNGLKATDNGDYADVAYLRQQYSLSENSFVIGTVGRLVPIKGQSFLIKAMAEVVKEIKNCHLLIAGEGPLRNNLQAEIEKLKISQNVRLIGYVHDIKVLMATLDLFVLPSLSEGLPISLLEAMAVKKPVIASDAGGIRELVTDRKDGILVPPSDSTCLAKAIKLLYYDKILMSNIAVRGEEKVKNEFSSSSMADNYKSIYSHL